MQQIDSFYQTAIESGHHIVGEPLIVAEWNYNQIFDPSVVNTPDDQNWAIGKKYFPAKSVGNSIRPNSTGIMAAITDESYTASENTLGIDGSRYYSIGGDPEQIFIYWMCPTPSHSEVKGATGNSETDDELPIEYEVDRGTLILDYGEYVNVNKIKVLFNLGPTPVSWSLFAHTQGAPGDGYVEITDINIDPITGRAEIWWDGANWVEEQQLDSSIFVQVDKLKLVVETIDQPASRLQVIELAACREIDLTDRMVEYSINLTLDDSDFIHPIGNMSSSGGEIVFSNDDLKINNQNPIADFHGLLAGRCQYRTYVKYNLEDYSGTTWISRTGTMYANDWQQVNEYEYKVELWDIVKILQTKKCPDHLFEYMSIARIVSQILDFIGVDNYALNPEDFDDTGLVKYFWTDGNETVYEVLDRLCRSHQAAIYVDEFGIINLITRKEIANEDDTPVWTFRGETDGAYLPDIQTLSKKYSLQANEVTIKYKQMEAPTDTLDITKQPLTSKVWETSDTVVLRASPLTRVVSGDGVDHSPVSDHDVFINSTAVATWPYKGKVNLNGELIEYDGKGYQYWNYSNTPPTVTEVLLYSDEDKKKWDQFTYNTFSSADPDGPYSTIGGISSDPTKQNRFTGRLFAKVRDANESDRMKEHTIYWDHGWMGMRAWLNAPGNSNFPTRYMEPGGSVYNMNNLKDYKNKPGWNSVQSRWSVKNSVVTCNNSGTNTRDPFCLIRDLEDTEYREMGTRLRVNGSGYAGMIFYLSDHTNGYDNETPTLTDPLLATRWYQLTVIATEEVERSGRKINEIYLEVKNGNNITALPSLQASPGSAGKWQIDKNRWYDIDIVVKDAGMKGDTYYAGNTNIEVYVDGQWVDTFTTVDGIRPTGLVGLHARWGTIAEFEYFYATPTTNSQRPNFKNDDDFSMSITQLPSGTGVTKRIDFPISPPGGQQSVLSFSSNASATITSIKIKGGSSNIYTSSLDLGPVSLTANREIRIDFDEAIDYACAIEMTYTSTADISVCYESSAIRNFPYDAYNQMSPLNSYYDISNGHSSLRLSDLAYINPIYPLYWSDDVTQTSPRTLYMDDFGTMVREVRDFDVDYDVAPAKGVRVYLSNDRVRLVDHLYNPVRGIFTLANASYGDEIVNGTEEIDETNSIDHSLMLYGYILEDKGDKTKVVKDEVSKRKYGTITMDVDAEWIFNEDDATELGEWIVNHWSEPMDTVALTIFSNTFIQISDKVNIKYSNANIDQSWLYIVKDRSTRFGEDGLETSVVLNRVR